MGDDNTFSGSGAVSSGPSDLGGAVVLPGVTVEASQLYGVPYGVIEVTPSGVNFKNEGDFYPGSWVPVPGLSPQRAKDAIRDNQLIAELPGLTNLRDQSFVQFLHETLPERVAEADLIKSSIAPPDETAQTALPGEEENNDPDGLGGGVAPGGLAGASSPDGLGSVGPGSSSEGTPGGADNGGTDSGGSDSGGSDGSDG